MTEGNEYPYNGFKYAHKVGKGRNGYDSGYWRTRKAAEKAIKRKLAEEKRYKLGHADMKVIKIPVHTKPNGKKFLFYKNGRYQ